MSCMIAPEEGFASLAFPGPGSHRARDAAPTTDARGALCAFRSSRYRVPHILSHPPVFTVAEAAALRGRLPGGHCKSLFLKDKKGGYWLAVMLEARRVDLKKLAIRLGAPRFSFGNAGDLHNLLGVRPGSVTPFALVNDIEGLVTPVLDALMLACDPLNYHPLENDRTTTISPGDLLRFIAATEHAPRIIELGDLDRESAASLN